MEEEMLLEQMSALSVRQHIHGLFMAMDVFRTRLQKQTKGPILTNKARQKIMLVTQLYAADSMLQAKSCRSTLHSAALTYSEVKSEQECPVPL